MIDSINPGNTLADAFAADRFVVTAEVAPTTSADPADLLQRAEPLRGRVDALNVTDAAGARANLSSVAGAAVLKRAGIEPVMQMTCRDRNRIAMQGDLLGAAALGVRNILVLFGDDPKVGDQPEAKPVYDYDSKAAIAMVGQIRDQGILPSGRSVAGFPPMMIGCADTVVEPEPGWRPDSLLAKAEAGANFVQTQFCFDVAVARRYVAALVDCGLAERLNLLLGVGPVLSAKSARWMNANLFGVAIPDAWIDRLDHALDPAAEGTALCADLIAGLREIDGVAGMHLMAPAGGAAAIARVLDQTGCGPIQSEPPQEP